MKFSTAQKLEVIRAVQSSELSVRQTLSELGINRSTYYGWYKRYLEDGEAALAVSDQRPGEGHSDIIHEAEARRLHSRLQMPVVARISDQQYKLHDISLGGFALLFDKEEAYSRVVGTAGTRAATTLVFAFGDLQITLEIEAQLVYVDDIQGKAGFRYSSLTNNQLANIRYFLSAYMEGEIVSTDDLLSRLAEDGSEQTSLPSLEEEPKKEADPISLFHIIRRRVLYAVIFLVGIASAVGLVNGYLDERYVVTADAATIDADLFRVRAPTDGHFTTNLNGHPTRVGVGDLIGTIRPLFGGTGPAIESPCDCLVLGRSALDGEFVVAGHDLLSLVDLQSDPHVSAIVPAEALRRIAVGDTGNVRLVSDDVIHKATVDKIQLIQAHNGAAADPTLRHASIRLSLNGKDLGPESVGTPAVVRFTKAPRPGKWIADSLEGPKEAVTDALGEYLALFK